MSEATLYLIDDDVAIIDSATKCMQLQGIVVRSFTSAEDFLAADDIRPPGCIVVDLKMPGLSGLELQSKLEERNERMPLIMISGHGDVESAISAFRMGADDFITKPYNPAEFLDKVRACFLADRQRLAREEAATRGRTRYDSLTQREREVFELLVQGVAGKEIARKLKISPRTVEKFRANLMRKMEADGIAQLVREAFVAGLFSLDMSGNMSPSMQSKTAAD